jgi:hypothetical protein
MSNNSFKTFTTKVLTIFIWSPIMITFSSLGGALFGATEFGKKGFSKAGPIGGLAGIVSGVPIGFIGGVAFGTMRCYNCVFEK